MAFRILVAYMPDKSPPGPHIPREWMARCIDTLPGDLVSTWTGHAFTLEGVGQAFHGRTREEVVEAVKQDIRARFQAFKDAGGSVECMDIDVEPF